MKLKLILKICFAIAVLLCLTSFELQRDVPLEIENSISEVGGEYVLFGYEGGEQYEICREASLSKLFESEALSGKKTLVLSGIKVYENLTLKNKELNITGSAAFYDADFIIEGGSVSIFTGDFKFYGTGGARLKSGQLSASATAFSSEKSSALRLDYSSGARAFLENCKLSSDSGDSALNVSFGSVYISDGEISCESGVAVKNAASLYLAGEVLFSGVGFDVETSVPISLSFSHGYLNSKVLIKYNAEFKKGTMTPVVYGAEGDILKNVLIFDKNGVGVALSFFESSQYFDEQNFGAVYLPHKISYFDSGNLISEKLLLSGEEIPILTGIEKSGFKLIGWKTEGGSYFDFSTKASSDMILTAAYELLPPGFAISSLDFVYDGEGRELGFDYISHPLLASGRLEYLWYRNGECISSSPKIKVGNVSDSDRYICKLTFTYGGYEATVLTEELCVCIRKAEVSIPEIHAKEYTGNKLYPESISSPYYNFFCDGGTDAGVYPVTIKLFDAENYKFSGSDASELTLDFLISKAENAWTSPPEIKSSYYGQSPIIAATAKFGEVRFSFSSSINGIYRESYPTEVGNYYMRAEVLEGNNYKGLICEPVCFSVSHDEITGISLKNPPSKLEYSAFERFEASGAVLLVSFSSGNTIEVLSSDIKVRHPRAEYFLFGDNFVSLIYGGEEITLAVTTKKAEYDISNVKFYDKTLVFDGNSHAPDFFGELPVGKDGIALCAEVERKEKMAGVYEIKLVFKSDSVNYNLPSPLCARLEIKPLSVAVVWENTSFVYDGGEKAPKAHVINEVGAKVPLMVSGFGSFAGEYSAVASIDNQNYILENSKCTFEILKADYDLSGAFWSKSEFVYDGEEKTVYLSGLPEGVTVIGYTDNKATNAGSYIAKATLDYDKINYNEPRALAFPFTVRRAEYDVSGFRFDSCEAVFDGELHYPILVGEMPIGKDGSAPTFSFDRGARHVSDGQVKVTVSFSCSSKNYNAPRSMEAFVTVKPCGISVVWENTSYVYTGTAQAPKATAAECAVYVVGAVSNAGVHTATAFTQNSDYFVINSKNTFEIARAENKFTENLKASDIYEGDAPNALAESLSKDVIYRFFSDRELLCEVWEPLSPGVYFAVAESAGGENYTAIRSAPVPFSVIELIPIAIYPQITAASPKAYSVLSEGDFRVIVEYNSGKLEEVTFDNVEIKYQNAESLRKKDSEVTFGAFGLSQTIPISVSPAAYDLSGVSWSNGSFVYDGEEKSIYISGLPEGVAVIAYTGNGKLNSGSYEVFAQLSYDAENYLEPKIPAGVITIEKAKLKAPVILPMSYSGKDCEIIVENADLCKYSKNLYRDSGTYSVVFTVLDSENYVFENGKEDIEVSFEILPKEVLVKISELELFLFEKAGNAEYTIVGEVFEGDELLLEFIYGDDSVTCESKNPNYKVTVEDGKIVRRNYPSPEAMALIFLFFLTLVVLTLMLIALISKGDRLKRLAVLSKNISKSKTESPVRQSLPQALPKPEKKEAAELSLDFVEASISSDKADELLSDGMAKTLIKHSINVETFGTKKRIINVGELSAHFSPGERVDINRMKSEKLIPYDTAYIKVLADGALDKPLSILANSFSLSAVKMIALMGGEAVKVNTVRIKTPRNEDE